MSNKHTEFIQLGNVRAFITGVPDKCSHIFEDAIYILGNGDIIVVKDYLCPTNEATHEYISSEVEKRNTYIQTGTNRCIKCKKVFEPDFDI